MVMVKSGMTIEYSVKLIDCTDCNREHLAPPPPPPLGYSSTTTSLICRHQTHSPVGQWILNIATKRKKTDCRKQRGYRMDGPNSYGYWFKYVCL